MKPDKGEQTIRLIRELEILARDGDEEAVEIIRAIGWHAAAALQSLSFWSGAESLATVRKVSEKKLSWPINYHVMPDARKDFENPEDICDQLNLGGKTGWKLRPTSKHRQLEPHHPTGWAFYVFGMMEREGIILTAEAALQYLREHPEIQVAPEAIHRRASTPNHSLESAIRDAFETALDSLT